MPTYKKVLLFYNSQSGHSRLEKHRDMLESHFKALEINLQIIEVPKPQEVLKGMIDLAIEEGVTLFIAAGGDGTASMIGNPLIGTGAHLGILPLGTGNTLAKELKIPVSFAKALETITADDPEVIQMDAFRLNGQYYLLNFSAGVTPQIMGGTESEEKKRFGLFAYFIHFFEQLLGLKRHRFEIEIDGKKMSFLASEILVTNSRSLGLDPLKWTDNVKINDGTLDLFVIRAANIFDIISLTLSLFTKRQRKSPIVDSFQVKHHCCILSPSSLPTQADGDPIGETPVEIFVNPKSLNVIVGKSNLYEKKGNK